MFILQRVVALLLLAVLLVARPAAALDATALDATGLEDALDKQVDVEMLSGQKHQGATLLKVTTSKRTGEPRSLRLRLPDGKTRTVGLRSVKSVKSSGNLVYERDPDDRPKRRMSRAERRAAAKAEEEKKAAEEHEKWLGRLQARGVRPWNEATDTQHQAAIDKYKATGQQAQEMFPGLKLYETQQFLFYSNIPSQQVGPFIARLDKMFAWMAKTYSLPDDTRVWLGKAPVYAFMEEREFHAFEQRFYKARPASGTYGLCHQDTRGEVLISCYRGQEPMEFAQMLVHETSHGFIHRYKTMQRLPSWVNEGMAEYIGALMVPGSKSVKRKEARAIARLKQQPILRSEFFGDGKIEFPEYGIASSMNRFMITTNADGYVEFIEKLKEGMPWKEALREAYGAEPADLLAAYGRWIGVPGLQVK